MDANDESSPPLGSARSTAADEFFELSDIDNCDLTTINAKTLQGIRIGGDEDDEDDGEDGKEASSVGSLLSFFTTGAGATFLLLVGFASLFGIVGGAGYALKLQKPLVLGKVSVWILCLVVAGLLTSLALIRILINLVFRGLGLVAPWNWIHHAKALEPHLTAIAWLSGCLCMTLHFLDEPDIVKAILAGLFMAACLAAKSYYMRGLAMSFNYENYRDRIETALKTDRVLGLLWRSRHAYKFKKRMVDSASGTRSSNIWRRGTRSMEASPKASLTPDHAQLTVRSVQPRTSSQCKNTSPSNGGSNLSKNVTVSEAEKKANFVKFYHLAGKTMGAVSSGSAADFRAENSRISRKQASKLFKYMRPDDRAYLTPADLRCYIEDEADMTFLLGLLKKHIKWQNAAPGTDDFIFAERALKKLIKGHLDELVAIMKSMQSIETALGKVDSIFSIVIILVVGLCAAIMFGNAAQLLVAMGTFLSGAAFIFSTAARNAFESLVFLLLLHPFDVGDRVFIALGSQILPTGSTIPATMSGSDALDNLVVVEMHLLSTVFERWDGVRVYVPNYVLATKPVFNIRRSGPLVELQRIQISFETPIAKIDELRTRLDKFVRADRTDFTDLSRVNFDAVESCNKIHLNVIAQYNGNWQDIDKQLAFKTRFLMFIKSQLEDLGIGYLPPVQRVAIVDPKGKSIQFNA